MRNPGRRDGDDVRAGSTDPTVPQAGSDGGPADDETVGMRAPDAPRITEPHGADHALPTGHDGPLSGPDDDLDLFNDLGDDLDDDLDAAAADVDDDLLFDPLLSDEPIDLAAVRADDALIDALSGGGLAGADDLNDDDPLIAMLAAWAASARPDPAAATRPTDPDVATTGPGPHLRPVAAAPVDMTVGIESVGSGRPDIGAAATGSPDAGSSDGETPDTGSPEQDETGGVTERRPDLDPPTVRLSAPHRTTAEDRPDGEPGDSPVGAPRVAATAAASVVTLISRVRTARRTRPPGQALPPGHPLRRAAVAVVVAALGVSGAAASGGTAQPGDPAWAITKVFFTERANSIEAAQVVSAGLERAQLLLGQRQPELAKQVLATIAASLPSVREEEGHTRLLDQQRMLEAVAALTPPLPGDPNLTSTTTPNRRTDPDTSVLAQGTPHAAGKDAAAPPVVVKPADPATGSTDATTGTTTGSTTGTTTGGTGTTGTTSAETGSTGAGRTGKTTTEKGTAGTTGSDTTGTRSTGTRSTGSTTVDPPGTGTGTGPGPVATETGPADTALAEAGAGPAATDTGASPGYAGAQAVGPAPDPTLDTARSAGTSGTPASGTQTSESSASETTTTDPTSQSVAPPPKEPETSPPAPPAADEPAPVAVLGAPEQPPDAPKALAAGSAPAVPAASAGPAEAGGAVVPDPVRTVVETGVVPEPVNVGAPTTTHEPTDKPTRDTAADRTSNADTSADTPTHTTSAGDTPAARDSTDTPEPVHVTADDNRGPGSSGSNSGSGSGGGSDSGSGSDNSGSDNSGSDGGGPGGAKASAAVSIHP